MAILDLLEVEVNHLIGSASARLGQRGRARQAFRASLEASPQEPSTYVNLGLVEMESGNRDAAVAYFTESLTMPTTRWRGPTCRLYPRSADLDRAVSPVRGDYVRGAGAMLQ